MDQMKPSINPLIPANAGTQIKNLYDSRVVQEGLNVTIHAKLCVL
jgi:hypothetical protein